MIVTCPKCASSLQVPDNAAGQHAECPACKQVFAIIQPVIGTQVRQPGAESKITGRGLLVIMAIFVLLGSMTMWSSLFMRWWRVAYSVCLFGQRPDAAQYDAESKRFNQIKDGSSIYYRQYLSRVSVDRIATFQQNVHQQKEGSLNEPLFGYNLGRGVMTFVFACVMIVLILPQIIFRFASRWGWTVNFVIFGLALIAFILDLAFLVKSPTESSPAKYVYVSQQLFEGAWIAMAASAFTMAWGLATAIVGLVFFIRGLRATAGQVAPGQMQNNPQ